MDWFKDTGITIISIIGAAIIIFLILRFTVPPIIRKLVRHNMSDELKSETAKRTKTLSSIIMRIIGVIIAIIAVITILPEFNINIATILAGIGVGGLAIAFAAQNLVRDFITGFFIILEDQYRIGDVVNIAGISGAVEEIDLRRTILRDVDGNVHSIPNGKVEISTNMTRRFSRINLDISVGYNEDLNRCISTINSVCQAMAQDPQWKDDLVTTPAVLRVNNLGDSGIDIKITGDTKPSRQWAVMGELRLRLKNTFDMEGIEIPWPHTKIYFGDNPPKIREN